MSQFIQVFCFAHHSSPSKWYIYTTGQIKDGHRWALCNELTHGIHALKQEQHEVEKSFSHQHYFSKWHNSQWTKVHTKSKGEWQICYIKCFYPLPYFRSPFKLLFELNSMGSKKIEVTRILMTSKETKCLLQRKQRFELT